MSTVHSIGTVILKSRCRPRVTKLNFSHVSKTWGSNPRVNIKIPKLVDDYNHWMGGVDLADQHIAYYHPSFQFRRTWMPIFVQLLSIIRSNCFIIKKNLLEGRSLKSKRFVHCFIFELMSLASKYVNDDIIVTNTLSHFGESDLSTMTPSHTIQTGSQETPKKKTSSKTNEVRVTRPFNVIDAIKRHIDPLLLTDNAKWLKREDVKTLTSPGHHLRKTTNNIDGKLVRSACEYCKEQYSQNKHFKLEVGPWDKEVHRTLMVCHVCDVYFCLQHFNHFHR